MLGSILVSAYLGKLQHHLQSTFPIYFLGHGFFMREGMRDYTKRQEGPLLSSHNATSPHTAPSSADSAWPPVNLKS